MQDEKHHLLQWECPNSSVFHEVTRVNHQVHKERLKLRVSGKLELFRKHCLHVLIELNLAKHFKILVSHEMEILVSMLVQSEAALVALTQEVFMDKFHVGLVEFVTPPLVYVFAFTLSSLDKWLQCGAGLSHVRREGSINWVIRASHLGNLLVVDRVACSHFILEAARASDFINESVNVLSRPFTLDLFVLRKNRFQLSVLPGLTFHFFDWCVFRRLVLAG